MVPVAAKPIDLVLAGGGVKGVGLVGAVVKLMDAGYRAYRVAGTSAGSLVGAIVAAAAKDDQLTGEQVKELALSMNYRKFLDPGPVESVPLLGPAWGILQGSGVYKGDYAHDFIASQLKNLGVRTFGDLRLDDDQLPEERRYRLVVTAADVTTDSWCDCRGTTAASTAATPTSSRWPTRCAPRCRFRSSSARSR
jgi:NTE family protein